jgi:hypothetical protein
MSDVEPVSDPASTAFDSLRGELALLRRCVEQLAAERNDFRPTIEELVERQDNVAGWLKHFSELPTTKLTPAQFAHDFSVATEHLRAEDREAVVEADRAIQRAVGRIDGIIGRGYTIVEQRRRVLQSALAGAGAAVFLWSIIPGVIARTLPESWHVPEWMAMRTMALNEQQAGERLLLLAKQRAAAVGARVPVAPSGDQGESYNQVSANSLSAAGDRKAKSVAAPSHRRNHSRSHRP